MVKTELACSIRVLYCSTQSYNDLVNDELIAAHLTVVKALYIRKEFLQAMQLHTFRFILVGQSLQNVEMNTFRTKKKNQVRNETKLFTFILSKSL